MSDGSLDWKAHHRIYEHFAHQAELALREGRAKRAKVLYREAAIAEEEALWLVPEQSSRTFAILAVSASVSWLKAGNKQRASHVASMALESRSGCEWARNELASLTSDGEEAGR